MKEPFRSGTVLRPVLFALAVGFALSVAQYVPIAHTPDTGPDQSLAMNDSALLAVLGELDPQARQTVERVVPLYG